VKIVMRIGYQHFLVPQSVNVNAIIAALAKATPLKHELSNNRYIYVPDRDGSTKCTIEMVEDDTVVDPAKTKRKALPEHASEDAHNTF
jgi:hypothetical protein